jgi:hypothetical protein
VKKSGISDKLEAWLGTLSGIIGIILIFIGSVGIHFRRMIHQRRLEDVFRRGLTVDLDDTLEQIEMVDMNVVEEGEPEEEQEEDPVDEVEQVDEETQVKVEAEEDEEFDELDRDLAA